MGSFDIYLTTQEIEVYFEYSLKSFYKEFKVEKNGLWKIRLDDIEKIKKISQFSFNNIKNKIIYSIRAKNLGLDSFYDIFKVGLRLLNTNMEIIQIYWKSYTTEQKEEYFKNQLTEIFVQTFSNVSVDAYLHGKKHADTIMFNKKNIKDLVFIEYAADIPIGNSDSYDASIFGHLNKIVDIYSTKKIDFFHNSHKLKNEEPEFGDYFPSQVWFIYFDQNLNSNDIIKSISNEKYEQINILLVDYKVDYQSTHLILHLKNHDEKMKDFKEIRLY